MARCSSQFCMDQALQGETHCAWHLPDSAYAAAKAQGHEHAGTPAPARKRRTPPSRRCSVCPFDAHPDLPALPTTRFKGQYYCDHHPRQCPFCKDYFQDHELTLNGECYGCYDRRGRRNPMHHGEWYRGADGQNRRVFRLNSTDTTPTHTGSYDIKCGYCMHGHAHSQALHQHEATNTIGNYWNGQRWVPRKDNPVTKNQCAYPRCNATVVWNESFCAPHLAEYEGWDRQNTYRNPVPLCWSCKGTRTARDVRGQPRACGVCRGTGVASPPPTPLTFPARPGTPSHDCTGWDCPCRRKNPRGFHHFDAADKYLAQRIDCPLCKTPITNNWCANCRAECHCRPGDRDYCTSCADRIERATRPSAARTRASKAARRQKKRKNPKKIHALSQVVNGCPVASCGAKHGLVSADAHAVTCRGCRRKGIARNAQQIARRVRR